MTPVRNEAWILPRFLACTSLWADHIVIADQMSDDGSRSLAARHPKVTLVDNPRPHFNEGERQRLLIETARRIPGPRILIALDADEILSANVLTSLDWQKAMLAPPGTVLAIAKVSLFGSTDQYFSHTGEDLGRLLPFGYIDDGHDHSAGVIHTCRVPLHPDSKWLMLRELAVLDYDHLNPPRQRSKARWYRCFERMAFPQKPIAEITRLYAGLERPGFELRLRSAPPEWNDAHDRAGIEPASIPENPVFWWDWEVLRMIGRHGLAPFRHLDLWSVDWEALRRAGLARALDGMPAHPIRPPLRRIDHHVRTAMRYSQRYRPRRVTDRMLGLLSALVTRFADPG